MPEWYYEKHELLNSPSFKDGVDISVETKQRREGARFIIDVGADLNLRYDTVATGCVYFHRFFMMHSFKEFNRHVAALGCLFLAGKVEETPKKCKDLLRVARQRLSDEQFSAFSEDPKEEVMTIERVLLQTIKFDLQLEHPYQFLIKYAKILKGTKDKAGIEQMVQMAWTFINDSLCTTICLQWEPEIVAIALMYLASRLGKCTITDWGNRRGVEGEKWWDQFVEDLNLDILEDICHQVLDLYSTPQQVAAVAPANLGGSESKLSTSRTSSVGTSPSTPLKISPSSAGTSRSEAPSYPVVLPATAIKVVAPPISNQQPPPPMPPGFVHHAVPPGAAPSYAMPVNVAPRPGGGSIYAYPPPNMATPPPGGPQFAYYPPPPQGFMVPPPRSGPPGPGVVPPPPPGAVYQMPPRMVRVPPTTPQPKSSGRF